MIIAHKIYHYMIIITIYNFELQWSHKALNSTNTSHYNDSKYSTKAYKYNIFI